VANAATHCTSQDDDVPMDEMDAYSRAVVGVAESVLPSVASLRVSTRRGQGSGSASVIDAEGHLLTSAHVVEGADRADAAFGDGTEIVADVVGRDPLSDLAVLKARGPVPPAVTLGDASALRVGQLVVAPRSVSPEASPPASCQRSAGRCPPHPAA